ncbi:MAG: LysE family transporter [Chloroflexi bacterium]|nr:LysE family transporter [Chloroflexota bacterium]
MLSQLVVLYATFMLISLSGALSPGPLTALAISEGARVGRWAGTRLALGHALVEIPLVFAIAYGLGAWLKQPLVGGLIGIIGAAVLLWMGYGLVVGSWRGQLTPSTALRADVHAARDTTTHENVMLSGLTNQRSPRRNPSEASLFDDRDSSLVSRRDALWPVDPLRVTNRSISRASIAGAATGPAPALLRFGHVPGGIAVTVANPYWSLWWATLGAVYIGRVMGLALGPLTVGGLALTHWLIDLVWLGGLSLLVASGRGLIGPRGYRAVLLICGAFLLVFGLYFAWTGIHSLWPA